MGDMDSANSGSLQSSSGGDDDYESTRGGAAPDSFYSLFNHQSNYPPPAHVTSFNPPPPTLPPAFFDPLASYLDHLSRSTNPDPVWPKDTLLTPEQLSIPSSSGPAAFQNPQPSSSTAGNSQTGQHSGSGGGVRNPKKRTRASRRAPTTVLTTNTTNFRAMVQEFTGIPAPPFGGGGGNSSSSLFYPRTRLDLFGGRMDAPAPSTNLPPYLLRPLAQKIPIPHPPPPPLVSTLTATNKNGSDVMTASSSGGGNFQIPDLGLFTTDVPTNLSFGSSLKYPSDSTDPDSSKPGFGGSLELPITTTARNDEVHDQLGGITASFFPTADAVNSSSGKNNGGGPFGWAEGLGLGADAASAGAPAPSTTPGLPGINNSRHSDHRPHNLGFAQQ
ncbi:hypothetical protein V2J09_021687 [Rumex salicifolius]